MERATYPIPSRGLATSFSEAETPIRYGLKFRNRFINGAGGAEKRQGLRQYGNTIPGNPTLTGLHELIEKDGQSREFTSGAGKIYIKATAADTWSETATVVNGAVVSAFNGTNPIRSVQAGNKLIFYDGDGRSRWTEDGSAFETLEAVVEKGFMGSQTSAAGMNDPDITFWANQTDVAIGDLVLDRNRGTYSLITAIASAGISFTTTGPSGTGISQGDGVPSNGDAYEIWDLVESNIIPTVGEDDNVALAGPGTGATVVAVSGLNFSNTAIRVGDYIQNTTRNAVTRVVSVSANVVVASVASQTNGDSLVFWKSATPIASAMHVHYNRLYMVDARDQRKVVISGPNDPTELTTNGGTFDAGMLQPDGDFIQSLASYQGFFVFFGAENVLVYQGTVPVGTSANFAPVGLFPQGTVSPYGAASIGNDLLFTSHEGVQSVSQVQDASSLRREGVTAAINNTLRDEIADTPTDQIALIHYPRRSWVMLKVGSQMYVYNYANLVLDERENLPGGSISVFDGKLARQRAFMVKENGQMLVAGEGGKVYQFDVGDYDDDGEIYTTELQTGWLNMAEPKRDIRTKQGRYIKPVISVGQEIDYTLTAEGDFDNESTDTLTTTISGGSAIIGTALIPFVIGGSPVQNDKYSLRWRGEVARFSFTTNDDKGPDIISRYTLYYNRHGAL